MSEGPGKLAGLLARHGFNQDSIATAGTSMLTCFFSLGDPRFSQKVFHLMFMLPHSWPSFY